ncbi:hypothetical protein AKJ38_00255 [candidate division MSBL1 archaeon SCGC-AAA259I14]|uniref:ABC transporter permease n=1 Tax=candidate division MSBL1 archaeon SCGC-AAA259I14 TaxID=1698268 RepID=A0A133UUA2_9EURY|nr:hypothetical protein AKJ38_00255 [candidate division MSBL1 archaeon SCGC-AAA259I14]
MNNIFGIKIKRRRTISNKFLLLIAIASIVTALIIYSYFFFREGVSPIEGYRTMIIYAFKPGAGLKLTIRRTVPIILLTLAFTIPKKAGIWNIGGQGQMYIGAIGATVASFALSNQPSLIAIPLAILSAAALAAGWGGIIGLVRGKLNVNEIVLTILSNFMAIYIVKHLVEGGPLTSASGRAESDLIPVAARMPEIGGTGIPYTIVISVGLAVLFFFFFRRTRLGFEIETVGINAEVAKKEGMDIMKTTIIVMIIAGALAGIAGYHQSANVVNRLRSDLAENWGFYAIVIGLLVNLDSLAAIIGSFFLSGILVGTQSLQLSLGMTHGSDAVFFGLVLFVMVAFQAFRHYRIVIGDGVE